MKRGTAHRSMSQGPASLHSHSDKAILCGFGQGTRSTSLSHLKDGAEVPTSQRTRRADSPKGEAGRGKLFQPEKANLRDGSAETPQQ